MYSVKVKDEEKIRGGLDVENESGGGGVQVGELLLEEGRCFEGLSSAHRDAPSDRTKRRNLLAMAIPTRYSQIVPCTRHKASS